MSIIWMRFRYKAAGYVCEHR